MKKLFTFVVFFSLLVASTLRAQWTYEGFFPTPSPDTIKGSTHGVAVDPDGKIWVGDYFHTAKIVNDKGDTLNCASVRVFNADGTEADFSPITTIQVGPFVTDTLWGNIRGMRADHEGNILVVTSKPYMMYKIDYKTGKGLNSVAFSTTPLGDNSPTAPAVDEYGNIYIAPVVPGAGPMIILDKDFNYVGNALATTEGFSRAFEVSKDGNTIYWAGYTLGKIIVYHRENVFADYDSVATILEGFHAESFAWNPANGYLYISAGSYNDMPTNGYTPGTWYGYDVTKEAIIDSFTWHFVVPQDPNERPRGIAFSPDGKDAYVGAFGTTDNPLLEKFHNDNPVSVEREGEALPKNYVLFQNYPNPFNPTTTLEFAIPKENYVTIKVYDALGRYVTTLLSKKLSSGYHSVLFDASNLSSGVYFYTLKAGNFTATKKMTLMK
jgi:sugar lactone lactonase YvrE